MAKFDTVFYQAFVFYILEFVEDISDLQIPHIAPVLLPEMLKIFSHPEVCFVLST